MVDNSHRFTEQWDAVDPFDIAYPHLWIKVEHLGRYIFAREYLEEEQVRSVLDIGCGTGYGSQELARNIPYVTGLDANLTDVANDAENIDFVRAEIGQDVLARHVSRPQYDAVVCFEVLEHLLDPKSALVEMSALMKPEGALILSVPNSVSERVRPNGLLSNRFHRRMFSISSICMMVEAAGFRICEVLGQPIAAEIARNETRLIRRKQLGSRIGDHPALHTPELIRQLAMVMAWPEPRDVERSYSLIIVATREPTDPSSVPDTPK